MRPLAGLVTVVVIVAIVVFAVGMFRGDFGQTVPVTVVSERAGLVMNPEAKVKMRGVQVGQVESIETRPDGKAVLHLAMDPDDLKNIPSNAQVDISSTTVFGAKSVEFNEPTQPSATPLAAGAQVDVGHVTVETKYRVPTTHLGAQGRRPGQAEPDPRRDLRRTERGGGRS